MRDRRGSKESGRERSGACESSRQNREAEWAWRWPWFLLVLVLAAQPSGQTQQALRDSMTRDLSVAASSPPHDTLPYTFKIGTARFLATPSLGLDYNDNVAISHRRTQEDLILRPLLQLNSSYLVTKQNLLRLHLGLGYDYYFRHPRYSSLRLESGSELSFDIYVKDVWLNLHDQVQYIQNAGGEAAVANTARYGGLDNMAGLTVTWDLHDVVLTLGYDHQNYVASSGEFDYLNRASELFLARTGFQVNPRLVAGLEGTGSLTAYDHHLLNDNTGYSAGVFLDWQPGLFFRVQPRAGYTVQLFDQTSSVLKAIDQEGWYASLALTHQITEAVSYTLSGGHEFRPGIEADLIEDTYLRPSVHWQMRRNLMLHGSVSYEHGRQGAGHVAGQFREDYDWLGGVLHLEYRISRNLSLDVSYRHTFRASDSASRGYTQNMVGLQATYHLQ